MTEVTVFSDNGGYSLTLRPKTEQELEKIKTRLKDLYTFRTPKR